MRLEFGRPVSWVLGKEAVENCDDSAFACPNATQHAFYDDSHSDIDASDAFVMIVRDPISGLDLVSE